MPPKSDTKAPPTDQKAKVSKPIATSDPLPVKKIVRTSDAADSKTDSTRRALLHDFDDVDKFAEFPRFLRERLMEEYSEREFQCTIGLVPGSQGKLHGRFTAWSIFNQKSNKSSIKASLEVSCKERRVFN
jgi:hypothetical protein